MNAVTKIKRALLVLLQDHSFTSLTVTLICARAGISRPTFYKYFTDKYDLMITVYEDDIAKCLQNDSWQKIMIDALSYIREHRQYMQAVLDYHGQNSFIAFLLTYTKQCTSQLITKRSGWPMDERLRYGLTMFTYGVCYTLIDWVRDGCHTSPEEFTRQGGDAMPVVLTPYLLEND